MSAIETTQRLTKIKALTFDCYGTIIDWDGGIYNALASIDALAGCDLDWLICERERIEYGFLADDYRPYAEVLGESMRAAAAAQGHIVGPEAQAVFVQSMGQWPAFGDSSGALKELAKGFRLALLSNVESATLRASIASLGVSFDAQITAEDVRSYKPKIAHFDLALERLGLRPDQILHVAGSLYHDIRPAYAAGWQVLWINRRGQEIPSDIDPAWVLPDLASLAMLRP